MLFRRKSPPSTALGRVSTSHLDAAIVLASEKQPSLAGVRRKDTMKLTESGPETGSKIGTPILEHSSASAASLRVGADWCHWCAHLSLAQKGEGERSATAGEAFAHQAGQAGVRW